ncbi:MAG TPA: FUSC family protein [Dongiaceae bacterium]|nr:FUSC family protein [Dongiaceae bacterium]
MRTAVVAAASFLVARMFRLPEAYWAPITTVVITQSTLGGAFSVSWKRFVGTALGALIGGLLATYFHRDVLLFAIAVLILGPLCSLLRADRSAYRFGGVTVGIVLLIPRTDAAWQVAFHRFAEVSIGIAVALLFATVWPEGEDPVT